MIGDRPGRRPNRSRCGKRPRQSDVGECDVLPSSAHPKDLCQEGEHRAEVSALSEGVRENYLMLPAATLRFLACQMLFIAALIGTILLKLSFDLSRYFFRTPAVPFAQRWRQFGLEAVVCLIILGAEAVLVYRFRCHNRLLEQCAQAKSSDIAAASAAKRARAGFDQWGGNAGSNGASPRPPQAWN
jgi:hypothetical protein